MTCRLTGERSYDRQIGRCEHAGEELGELVIRAGLTCDCPRYSDGSYVGVEPAVARKLPLPAYCRLKGP